MAEKLEGNAGHNSVEIKRNIEDAIRQLYMVGT